MGKFRVWMYESERGWGSDSWYSYFDTLKEAKEHSDKFLPSGNIVPDYYLISRGIEQNIAGLWVEVR